MYMYLAGLAAALVRVFKKKTAYFPQPYERFLSLAPQLFRICKNISRRIRTNTDDQCIHVTTCTVERITREIQSESKTLFEFQFFDLHRSSFIHRQLA